MRPACSDYLTCITDFKEKIIIIIPWLTQSSRISRQNSALSLTVVDKFFTYPDQRHHAQLASNSSLITPSRLSFTKL